MKPENKRRDDDVSDADAAAAQREDAMQQPLRGVFMMVPGGTYIAFLAVNISVISLHVRMRCATRDAAVTSRFPLSHC